MQAISGVDKAYDACITTYGDGPVTWDYGISEMSGQCILREFATRANHLFDQALSTLINVATPITQCDGP
jgi:hypothetical protein